MFGVIAIGHFKVPAIGREKNKIPREVLFHSFQKAGQATGGHLESYFDPK